jgi:competence protein ComEC
MSRLHFPLFGDRREMLLSLLVILSLLVLRLLGLYGNYRDFMQSPFLYLEAHAIRSYPSPQGHPVVRFRCDSPRTFYAKYRGEEPINGKRLRLRIRPNPEISFIDYLRGAFVDIEVKRVYESPKNLREKVAQYIESQHENPLMASFYKSIFIADTPSAELREKISLLGVSHLVALSGFHLGIISFVIFSILKIPYSYFQDRYFPYRNRFADLGMLSLLIIFLFMLFTGSPPSLLRSFGMMLIGWFALITGLELMNFAILFAAVCILPLLFPYLLFCTAFWLSVCGVFYIYLLGRFVSTKKSGIYTKLLHIPFGIFILMTPIVHSIFPATSAWQLLSPILSIVFPFFYPLAIFAHLVGYGGLFDSALLYLFSLPSTSFDMGVSTLFLLPYIGISLLCIWYPQLLKTLLLLAISSFVYIFAPAFIR